MLTPPRCNCRHGGESGVECGTIVFDECIEQVLAGYYRVIIEPGQPVDDRLIEEICTSFDLELQDGLRFELDEGQPDFETYDLVRVPIAEDEAGDVVCREEDEDALDRLIRGPGMVSIRQRAEQSIPSAAINACPLWPKL